MARVLVVFHRGPWGQWRSTYDSHLNCIKRVAGNDYFYLNSAWPAAPRYLKRLNPDLVIFHYTFLAVRQIPAEFEKHCERIGFLKDVPCRKALVPHDEHAHADLLCSLSRDFGVTHIFSPASESVWPKIYRELDLDAITFRTVLTGYIDEATVAKYAVAADAPADRPIDVGYRSWSIQPSYGRHGLLKREIGRAFSERAPGFGLVPDISSDFRDAFFGESWFDFLLRCKYTIGVEGGTSILDFDGGYSECGKAYLRTNPNASFEEVEAACFPGVDGHFDYFLLGPRHLEAVLTKTCQVLIEGAYGGTLEAGTHYIPLKKDFSNLDDVLLTMKRDDLRGEMVERAYEDVIRSHKWTYDEFARLLLDTCFEGTDVVRTERSAKDRWLVLRNRVSCNRWFEKFWAVCNPRILPMTLRVHARSLAVALLGEERLWRILVRLRNLLRRMSGRPPLDLGGYRPTPQEIARRERSSYRRSTKQWARDAVVLIVGEERLWKMLIRTKNLLRRATGKPPVDVGDYQPTAAEIARRNVRFSKRRK